MNLFIEPIDPETMHNPPCGFCQTNKDMYFRGRQVESIDGYTYELYQCCNEYCELYGSVQSFKDRPMTPQEWDKAERDRIACLYGRGAMRPRPYPFKTRQLLGVTVIVEKTETELFTERHVWAKELEAQRKTGYVKGLRDD